MFSALRVSIGSAKLSDSVLHESLCLHVRHSDKRNDLVLALRKDNDLFIDICEIDVTTITALGLEIINFTSESTLTGLYDPITAARLLEESKTDRTLSKTGPLFKLSVEFSRPPTAYIPTEPFVDVAGKAFWISTSKSISKSHLMICYCPLETSTQMITSLSKIWRYSLNIPIIQASDSFNALFANNNENMMLSDEERQGKASSLRPKIQLGLPKWVTWIPSSLYRPSIRRFLASVISLWTVFSAIWALWQLYNHFEVFRDAVRPLVQAIYVPFAAFFNIANAFLLKFTTFWIEVLRPVEVLLTSVITTVIYYASPMFEWLQTMMPTIASILLRIWEFISKIYRPIISIIEPVFIEFRTLIMPLLHLIWHLLESFYLIGEKIFNLLYSFYATFSNILIQIWRALPTCDFCQSGILAVIWGAITVLSSKIMQSFQSSITLIISSWRRVNELNLSETKHLRDQFKNNLKKVVDGVTYVISPVIKNKVHKSPLNTTLSPALNATSQPFTSPFNLDSSSPLQSYNTTPTTHALYSAGALSLHPSMPARRRSLPLSSGLRLRRQTKRMLDDDKQTSILNRLSSRNNHHNDKNDKEFQIPTPINRKEKSKYHNNHIFKSPVFDSSSFLGLIENNNNNNNHNNDNVTDSFSIFSNNDELLISRPYTPPLIKKRAAMSPQKRVLSDTNSFHPLSPAFKRLRRRVRRKK